MSVTHWIDARRYSNSTLLIGDDDTTLVKKVAADNNNKRSQKAGMVAHPVTQGIRHVAVTGNE